MKVFGIAHGLIFVAVDVVAIHAAAAFGRTAKICLLELLASGLPLTSVMFLISVTPAGPPDRSA